ncbi:hypothetical protein BaRGS_00001061 [Batillaria attramentaria]|uniref:Uncharacterized protein n=1 Tax=Batillaria attramentaria TaxID=370345 RepID=A0ABD0M6R7_9CAEN
MRRQRAASDEDDKSVTWHHTMLALCRQRPSRDCMVAARDVTEARARAVRELRNLIGRPVRPRHISINSWHETDAPITLHRLPDVNHS